MEPSIPLRVGATRREIIVQIPSRIAAYNSSPRSAEYNQAYGAFMRVRRASINEVGSLRDWLLSPGASSSVRRLMYDFGMGRGKGLVAEADFTNRMGQIPDVVDIQTLSAFEPDREPLSKAVGVSTFGREMEKLLRHCSKRGNFSYSGGFVNISRCSCNGDVAREIPVQGAVFTSRLDGLSDSIIPQGRVVSEVCGTVQSSVSDDDAPRHVDSVV